MADTPTEYMSETRLRQFGFDADDFTKTSAVFSARKSLKTKLKTIKNSWSWFFQIEPSNQTNTLLFEQPTSTISKN